MYPNVKIKHRINSVIILAISTAAIILLYNLNPSASSFFPPCPIHKITGLYCPGCGSLRALHQLFNGNILRAFRFNPLMIVALPFISYSFLSYILDGIIGKRLHGIFIPAFYIWLILAIILLFGILRNIRIYPFFLLAPC